MALAITATPAGELLSVEEAKRHLRVLVTDHDTEIESLIRDARDYCERWTQRTLRAAVTRTKTFEDWWQIDERLPFPPLLASPAPVITYYDADDDSQTLNATNYHVEIATDGGGRIVWSDSVSLPNIFNRPDAITITYRTGYADLASVPPVAVRALKLVLTTLWGAGTENEIETAWKRAKEMLGTVDWTGYV
jgi:hypothetical protein